MELPKDWEAIASQKSHGVIVRDVVERCYALHSKPRKELTDAEIEALDRKARENLGTGWQPNPVKFARDVIAAHTAKQREPETVTFRAARRIDTGRVEPFPADFVFTTGLWEWLDHDGKPQTFEVKV